MKQPRKSLNRRSPDRGLKTRAARRGVALLLCLFVMAATTLVVVAVLDTETLQQTALRHTVAYERAYYLASAAVHHALAELEANSDWRAGIPSTEFPAGSGNTYAATASSLTEDRVLITGQGTAGGVTRKLTVTVEFGM